jgi:coenzyme F420 hydrogenase subunit beta
MQGLGPRELLEDVHRKNRCVACGACVDLCPYFRSYKGKVAMLFPCNRTSGRCYAYCPKTEVDLDLLARQFRRRDYDGDPLGHPLKVMTAWAGSQGPKGLFQAGGTVSSLVAFGLAEGLLDAVVLTDREGMIPVPRLVTRSEEVAACASSKYTAAPTLSVLHRAVREGYTRIGVVGTPCQATAVAKMGLHALQENLPQPVGLFIGLFCTWAVDTRGLAEFLSKRFNPGSVRKMDIPPPPAEKMVIETGDGNIEIPLSEIRSLVPQGCRLCPDMTAEWADISVGVLEEDPGRNTLVIRTERGMEVVEKAIEGGWLSSAPISDAARSHLAFASANKRKRALQRASEEGALNTTGDARSCLRLNEGALNRVLEGSGYEDRGSRK